MNEITIITNIAKGLIEILGKPKRLDIQSFQYGEVSGYVGYLMYRKITYMIRTDGSIEANKNEE